MVLAAQVKGWLREELGSTVKAELIRCTGCGRCLRACPLPEAAGLDVAELNRATLGQSMDQRFVEFTLACYQCASCRAVCPQGFSRDLMVLWNKAKFSKMPYPGFMRVRGRRLSWPEKLAVKGHNLWKGRHLGELRACVDRHVPLNQARVSTVFYFACYLFSPSGITRPTLELADYLGMSYTVLGGLAHCCGFVHYACGQLAQAEDMLEDLARTVAVLAPAQVITGCGECYLGLQMAARRANLDVRIMTTAQWLLQSSGQLPQRRLPVRVAVHEACQISRRAGDRESAAELAGRFAEVIELPAVPPGENCCAMMAAAYRPEHTLQMRRRQLEATRLSGADVLLTECISCWEKYDPLATEAGLEIWDVVRLAGEVISLK